MPRSPKVPKEVWCWRINGGPWIATTHRIIADECAATGLPCRRYTLARRKARRKAKRGRKGGK